MSPKRKFDLSTPEGRLAYYEHTRLNASRREMREKRCPECGVAFIGIKIARYCSNACRQRHHYYSARVRAREQGNAD